MTHRPDIGTIIGNNIVICKEALFHLQDKNNWCMLLHYCHSYCVSALSASCNVNNFENISETN